MFRAEGPRQFHLDRLLGRKSLVKVDTLTRQRLVPLVGFIRNEDCLGLAMRPERDWSAAAPSRRNRATMPDSRARTSDSECTWSIAGLDMPAVFQSSRRMRNASEGLVPQGRPAQPRSWRVTW